MFVKAFIRTKGAVVTTQKLVSHFMGEFGWRGFKPARVSKRRASFRGERFSIVLNGSLYNGAKAV